MLGNVRVAQPCRATQNWLMPYTIDLRTVPAPLKTVPCSGDILASALAVCEESTLRSVAANMGIELESVHVDPERAKRLVSSAERFCSTLQTLRHGVEVSTEFALE